MKVLLIQPPFERLMGYSRYYTHLGLLSLAAVLKQNGHDVIVYDADYCKDGESYNNLELMMNYDKYVERLSMEKSEIWDEVHDVTEKISPDVVGLTVLSVTLKSARRVVSIVKSINSKIRIITGGVHATLRPDDLVDISDYVIQNEGESVICGAVMREYSQKIIKGERITDLNELPHPALECLYGIENYNKRDLSMVMSSRGCPNVCAFCSSPVLWNRRVVHKSIDYFIEEIQQISDKYGVTDFYISDDSFGCDRKWLLDFCSKIKKLNVTWRCLDRIDLVKSEVLDAMIDAGCKDIKYGIESGSQRMLDFVNKRIKVEQVYEADKILKEKDIEWSAFFIVGFPGEKVEDIRQTQKVIRDISTKNITLSIFTPYIGTKLEMNKEVDYTLYSHHSPYNNFTGGIPNEVFKSLVLETFEIIDAKHITGVAK